MSARSQLQSPFFFVGGNQANRPSQNPVIPIEASQRFFLAFVPENASARAVEELSSISNPRDAVLFDRTSIPSSRSPSLLPLLLQRFANPIQLFLLPLIHIRKLQIQIPQR